LVKYRLRQYSDSIQTVARILCSNLYSTDARNIYPELKPVAAEIDGIHLG
jgi:hypothetical protein